jgi:hypothetical protein
MKISIRWFVATFLALARPSFARRDGYVPTGGQFVDPTGDERRGGGDELLSLHFQKFLDWIYYSI